MASSAYLKLVDFNNVQLIGPSQVEGHVNEIELIHWGWGADQVLLRDLGRLHIADPEHLALERGGDTQCI